jgi:hypothetical protein
MKKLPKNHPAGHGSTRGRQSLPCSRAQNASFPIQNTRPLIFISENKRVVPALQNFQKSEIVGSKELDYACIYIYTYIRIYIHTHVYIYIYMHLHGPPMGPPFFSFGLSFSSRIHRAFGH